jgi:hypothetical protein
MVCATCTVLVLACATQTPTATPGALSVTDQLASGHPLYATGCATPQCHDTQGERIRQGDSFRIWPLVGAEFQSRNPNAQVIFDVVRSGDEQSLRAMTDQQIYDAIAYELSLNQVHLQEPLTARNAAGVRSGKNSQAFGVGMIFPPSNAVLFAATSVQVTWPAAVNGYVDLRVDQLAQASAIGNSKPPEGGSFVVVVFALQDLAGRPLDVAPQFLRLYDARGQALEPQAIDLTSAVERFHAQKLEPDHGTAATAIFALPSGTGYERLVYDDSTGHPLSLDLPR